VRNNKQETIPCAECECAQPDKYASTYTRKHCKSCDKYDTCEICWTCQKRSTCKARKNAKHKQSCDRRAESLCSEQMRSWTAYQCTLWESEYHRALLNVALNGNRQDDITWSGCAKGERRVG
jgi:hypothetical protein